MQNNLSEVAASWWIKQIKEYCSKRHPSKLTDQSFLDKLSYFQELLALELDTHIQNNDYFYLGCYYFPTRELSSIAEKAKMHYSYFPRDIEMQLENGIITVSVNNHPSRQLF